MIKLNRGAPPAVFTSAAASQLMDESRQFFDRKPHERAQEYFNFQKVSAKLYPAIRKALHAQFPAKCAYCETLVENPDIEAFRPKQRAANLDGSISNDHYWWLTFEWSNYLFACRSCNALKGTRFPIKGKRAPTGTTGPALADENPYILDPCEDQPEKMLIFLDDGQVSSNHERGFVTIEVLGLNRKELVEARKKDLKALRKHLHTQPPKARNYSVLVTLLEDMTLETREFAAMRRQYVRSWAIKMEKINPRLGRLTRSLREFPTALTDETRSIKPTQDHASRTLEARARKTEKYSLIAGHVSKNYYAQTRIIERFELTNIRNFSHLDVRIPIGSSKGGEWFVFLGENGCGKSTILQALACTIVGRKAVKDLKIRATDLLRRGCSQGEVRVHVTGMSQPIVMTLLRENDSVSVEPPEPKVMVLGYGATRLLTGGHAPRARNSRMNIRNLFDSLAQLSNGRPWLYNATRRDFDRFARALSTLLPSPGRARFSRRNGEIHVETPEIKDTLSAMSSGYQAIIALALDIMSVMRLGWDDMRSAEGIVLIDEIDAHLHPRWKMTIVKRLREAFPRIQFIATTHEPLTLRDIDRDEVAVLQRVGKASVEVITSATHEDLPSPRSMRVDQLLTSELFGLHSTTDPEVDDLFENYYTLLAKRRRTKADESRLAEHRGALDSIRRMGLTPRERMVYEAADSYIAKRRTSSGARSDAARTAARRELQKVWASIKVSKGGSRAS